jgi:hypothetical protein
MHFLGIVGATISAPERVRIFPDQFANRLQFANWPVRSVNSQSSCIGRNTYKQAGLPLRPHVGNFSVFSDWNSPSRSPHLYMLSHHSRRPKNPGALHNLGGSETLRSAPICRDWGGHPVFAATFGVSLIAFRDNLGSGLELVAEKAWKTPDRCHSWLWVEYSGNKCWQLVITTRDNFSMLV